MAGSSSSRTAPNTPARENGSGELMPAGTCAAVPSKSAVMWSPSMATVAWILTGPSLMLSASIHVVKEAEPSGIAAISRLADSSA